MPAQRHMLDAELPPPFEGFPKKGLAFLSRLKKNNNRDWFAAHKGEFEEFVRLPMQSLIASLKAPLQKIAPGIVVDPKRSMFRIYRDTRFSKNKAPYKTHVAAVFNPTSQWQDSAGFYIHIEPAGVYLGGGIYMPTGDQLKLLRGAIDEKSDEFLSILSRKPFKSTFGSLQGERLSRVPRGYPKDHPMADWLRLKQMYTSVEWPVRISASAAFVNKAAKAYADMYPLVRFLNEALGI